MSGWRIGPEGLKDIINQLEIDQNCSSLDERGGIKRIARLLKTDLKDGLSNEEKSSKYKERKENFGDNRIPRPPTTSFLRIFLGSFKDLMLIILMIMAVISILLQVGVPLVKHIQNSNHTPEKGEFPWYLGWVEGFAILIAVIIVSVVTTVNDWQTEKRFRELAEQGDKIDVKVVRGGKDENICIDDLFPGDIVNLATGDRVPADGVLLVGYDMKTDESSLTGETDVMAKNDNHVLMMSGTEVREGTGTMLVVAVGPYSIWGKMMLDVTSGSKREEEGEENDDVVVEDDKTPLQNKLDLLAKKITIFAFLVALFALGVLIIGLAIKKGFDGTYTFRFTKEEICSDEEWIEQATPEEMKALGNCGSIGEDLTKIVTFIIFAVTIVVAAVPEGLPLAVTISLAYSAKQMLKDHNLVRKLKSCETMGGANTICSDKTGTLTLNEMRVVKTWISGVKYYTGLLPNRNHISEKVLKLITEGIAVNSSANLIPKEEHEINPQKPIDEQLKFQGNVTEAALLFFSQLNLRTPYKPIRSHFEDAKLIRKKFSFSSMKKRMSCIIELDDGTHRLYCKGAAEIVLEYCSSYMDKEGREDAINDEKREEFEEMIRSLSRQGLRTLSLAYRDLSIAEIEEGPQMWDQAVIERDLILYQIVGIKDPLRKEVLKAVKDCKRAGIIVRMVTGDNIDTAKHIARECTIFDENEGHVCLEGHEFREMPERQVRQLLPKLRVMARSKPEDKRRLVKILMNMDKCVAVTGDGTNDAPALKKADVGLSMGISGTEVAKAASDIVVLDDNFASIVKAVLWGRTIYDNIRKFLQFQLSVNVVACTLAVLCSLTQYIPIKDATGQPMESEVPFTAVQLLWVNLIMDTLAALALATELPVHSVLDRNPYSKTESFINWKMWVSIFTQSAYQLLILIFIHYVGIYIPIFQTLSYGDFKTCDFPDGFPNYKFIPSNRVFRPWVKNTMVFNTFVFLQVFNEFNCRRINMEWNIFENLHKNFMFMLILVSTVVVQIVIIEIGAWEPLHLVVSTTGLEWYQWLICIGLGSSCIFVHYIKNLCMIIMDVLIVKPCFSRHRDEEEFSVDSNTGYINQQEMKKRRKFSLFRTNFGEEERIKESIKNQELNHKLLMEGFNEKVVVPARGSISFRSSRRSDRKKKENEDEMEMEDCEEIQSYNKKCDEKKQREKRKMKNDDDDNITITVLDGSDDEEEDRGKGDTVVPVIDDSVDVGIF